MFEVSYSGRLFRCAYSPLLNSCICISLRPFISSSSASPGGMSSAASAMRSLAGCGRPHRAGNAVRNDGAQPTEPTTAVMSRLWRRAASMVLRRCCQHDEGAWRLLTSRTLTRNGLFITAECMFSEKVRAATGQLLWTNDYSYCLGNNVALHTYTVGTAWRNRPKTLRTRCPPWRHPVSSFPRIAAPSTSSPVRRPVRRLADIHHPSKRCTFAAVAVGHTSSWRNCGFI